MPAIADRPNARTQSITPVLVVTLRPTDVVDGQRLEERVHNAVGKNQVTISGGVLAMQLNHLDLIVPNVPESRFHLRPISGSAASCPGATRSS